MITLLVSIITTLVIGISSGLGVGYIKWNDQKMKVLQEICDNPKRSLECREMSCMVHKGEKCETISNLLNTKEILTTCNDNENCKTLFRERK